MAKIQAPGASSQSRTIRCSSGVLEPFAGEVDRLLSASLADNTVKLYNQAVSTFDAFRTQYNFQTSWPPNINVLVNFIAFLSSEGYSFSTAKSYLSGISFYIKLNGWPDLSEAFVVKKMLKGFQRINPTKGSRAPITLQMLQAFPMALKMLHLPLMKHFSFQQPFRLPFLVFFVLVK